jgi:hypothetical protein
LTHVALKLHRATIGAPVTGVPFTVNATIDNASFAPTSTSTTSSFFHGCPPGCGLTTTVGPVTSHCTFVVALSVPTPASGQPATSAFGPSAGPTNADDSVTVAPKRPAIVNGINGLTPPSMKSGTVIGIGAPALGITDTSTTTFACSGPATAAGAAAGLTKLTSHPYVSQRPPKFVGTHRWNSGH